MRYRFQMSRRRNVLYDETNARQNFTWGKATTPTAWWNRHWIKQSIDYYIKCEHGEISADKFVKCVIMAFRNRILPENCTNYFRRKTCWNTRRCALLLISCRAKKMVFRHQYYAIIINIYGENISATNPWRKQVNIKFEPLQERTRVNA